MRNLRVFTKKDCLASTCDLSDLLQDHHDDDALLLESADIITKHGEKSMLFLDLALKVEARGDIIRLIVLAPEAQLLLDCLEYELMDYVKEKTQGSLILQIPPLHEHVDLIEKMRAISALEALRSLLKILRASDLKNKAELMLSGVFAYDFLDHIELLPKPRCDRQGLPDYLFFFPLTIVLLDHREKKTNVLAHSIFKDGDEGLAERKASKRLKAAIERLHERPKLARAFNSSRQPTIDVDIGDEDFLELVDKCKDHIDRGDVYQIVPSRTFSCPIDDELSCYRSLRKLNPSPYMFFMRTKDWTLFGSSPETFIKVDNGGERVFIRPIAGTRRRGFFSDGTIDPELDSREQASLCLDEKELAEHMMLVDLARNDIASVSVPHSRRINRLLAVDRFSHVMHLVSEVEGKLRDECDALSAFQACMNMGTLMGAPKVKAAELLRRYEFSKRGFYGGAIGYIDVAGDMDTSIIIRSALVLDKVAHVRAGCGVVRDSVREFEMQETKNKAEAVLKAIALAG